MFDPMMLDPHVPRWFVDGITKEVIIGLLGGLLVWTGARLKRFASNRMDRHRFPLAGAYISQFEDETNHGKVWVSAPVKLKQRGLKIDGMTHMVDKIAPVKIRKVSKETAASCMAIAESQLGKDYIPEKDFLNTHFYSVYGTIKREVAGFAIGKSFEQQDFLKQFPQMAGLLSNLLPWSDTVGMVSSVAMRQDCQRRGMGYSLVQNVLAHFDSCGVPLVVMLGWSASDGVHIAGIARALGFAEKATIPEYWHDDSLSKGYQCPVCGAPPCHCSAVLYVRHQPVHA